MIKILARGGSAAEPCAIEQQTRNSMQAHAHYKFIHQLLKSRVLILCSLPAPMAIDGNAIDTRTVAINLDECINVPLRVKFPHLHPSECAWVRMTCRLIDGYRPSDRVYMRCARKTLRARLAPARSSTADIDTMEVGTQADAIDTVEVGTQTES